MEEKYKNPEGFNDNNGCLFEEPVTNIEDAEFEEIDADVAADLKIIEEAENAKAEKATAPQMSKQDVVKALSSAVEFGQLTKSSAQRIRQEMGIFQTDFTKKKVSDTKRKAKRKAQKLARKKQRK